MEKVNVKDNVFFKVWNSPTFSQITVKFGNILEILEGIAAFLIAVQLFKEKSILFGIAFLIAAICGILRGLKSLLLKKASSQLEELDPEELKKKKRNFCIGIVVLIALSIFLVKTGGGTYIDVQEACFGNSEGKTVGEVIESNIPNAKWSQEKLGKNTKIVYVEGYCPEYEEHMRIGFSYQSVGDSFILSIDSILMKDSGEVYNGDFATSIIWTVLCQQVK